jgi:hypothetical protein
VSDLIDNAEPHLDPEQRIRELEQQMQEMRRDADKRVLQANLQMEAVRAGMIDLDGIKLIETAGIRMTEDGKIAGGADLMQRLKRDKPWLFSARSSSAPAEAPPHQLPQPKLAIEMTDEEYRVARAQLLKRLR